MTRAARVLAALVALLAVVLLVRTLRFTSIQRTVAPAPVVAIDGASAAVRLAGALRFETVASSANGAAQVQSLRHFLEESFPRVHATLTRDAFEGGGVLYEWRGTDPSLAPMLLLGHLDVVPATDVNAWTHPPFEGRVADGLIWGRGALDDKGAVLAIFEAVEGLIADGVQPRRTVYLAFGADEEIGGRAGAARIADRLASRGVKLESVLDEGGFVVSGVLPIEAPVALVAIAEKGYLSLRLTVDGTGGHASIPPRETPIGILSRAVAALEAHPFPSAWRGPTAALFDTVGREMAFGRRLVFANTWLFRPLIQRQLPAAPATDALMRTTIAPTMIEGGEQENVLPARARAVVNFRIAPGDTLDSVAARVTTVIDDPRVRIERLDTPANDPSPVSPVDAAAFQLLERCIREVLPDTVVAPYLATGATDARYFQRLSTNIYRFRPWPLGALDLARIHGLDERLPVGAYVNGVRFYRRWIGEASR